MTALCSTCSAPAVRQLGTRDLCVGHYSDVIARRISPSTWAWRGTGIGLPTGPVDVEGTAMLRCPACGATWSGPLFSDCGWCIEAAERQREWQAEVTLSAPGVDPADREFDAVSLAWRGRLQRAVEAGIVTAEAAQRAWRRHAEGAADVAA